jgi:hypothetical protein
VVEADTATVEVEAAPEEAGKEESAGEAAPEADEEEKKE